MGGGEERDGTYAVLGHGPARRRRHRLRLGDGVDPGDGVGLGAHGRDQDGPRRTRAALHRRGCERDGRGGALPSWLASRTPTPPPKDRDTGALLPGNAQHEGEVELHLFERLAITTP